jgi:putative copper resistance protein D
MDRQPADLRMGFPIVHDGADEAAVAYTLFRRSLTSEGIQPDPPMPTHLEFLIDRQGYIRARWIAWDGPGWSDAERLVTAIDHLNQEKPRAPAPDEHVH